jgi:hypothetical protein
MKSDPKKSTVTLEDLLRMKRAERPPAEFWSEFERDLRAKQLAAIVEPRPWWAPFIRISAKFSRYPLPVGATAILALTFLTVREYRAPDAVPAYESGIAVAPLDTAEPLATHVASPASSSAPMTDAMLVVTTPVETVSPAAVTTGQRSHTVPLARVQPEVVEPSPSARYIAANLAAAQADQPGIVDEVFGRMPRVAASTTPVRDPLAQLSSRGETRRSRLMAMVVEASVSSEETVMPSSDRLARRLTEDRLYDSISRIGVQGDRVAIKF